MGIGFVQNAKKGTASCKIGIWSELQNEKKSHVLVANHLDITTSAISIDDVNRIDNHLGEEHLVVSNQLGREGGLGALDQVLPKLF